MANQRKGASMRGGVRAGVAAFVLLGSMCCAVPQAGAEGAYALGDSITAGAQSQLQQAGYTVDAVTGRTFAEGLAVLRGYAGDLPSRVLVNLGSNSGVTAAQCRELTSLVGADRDLTLVTVNIPAAPDLAQRSNSVLRECASAAGARLMDWAGYTRANPGVLCPDGLHISCGGAPAYARFVLSGTSPGTGGPAGSGGSGAGEGAAKAKAAADANAAEQAQRAARVQAEAEAKAAADARAAAQAEAARLAAEAEAARLAAEAEAVRIAAEEWARTLLVLQTRRAASPAEVDRRVSPETYRFRSLGERLSTVAAAPSS